MLNKLKGEGKKGIGEREEGLKGTFCTRVVSLAWAT